MAFFCCLPRQGGNLIIGQASKPKKALEKMAAVDLTCDQVFFVCVCGWVTLVEFVVLLIVLARGKRTTLANREALPDVGIFLVSVTL